LLSAYDDGGVYLSRISLSKLEPLDELSSAIEAASAASLHSSSMDASVPSAPSSVDGAVPSTVEASYLDHDDCISAIAVVPSGSHFMSTSWDCTCVFILEFIICTSSRNRLIFVFATILMCGVGNRGICVFAAQDTGTFREQTSAFVFTADTLGPFSPCAL
jgi:hypothetical protein